MDRRDFLETVLGSAVVGAVVGWPECLGGQSGPVISGVVGPVAHGRSISIGGVGFGTKPTAAPLKYDDFQNLSLGQVVQANGWEHNGDGVDPVASDGNLRSGTPFTRNAHCLWTSANQASNMVLRGLTWTRFYFDGWHYFHVDGDPQPQNIKPIRWHTLNAGAPNMYLNFYTPSTSDGIAHGRDGTPALDSAWFGSSGSNGGISNNDWPGSQIYNCWTHFQIIGDIGTPGVANGTWIIYLNSRLRWNRPGNTAMIASGYPTFPELYIGNYVRTDVHGTCHAYWDSVYVDSSWARVELGDNATYANCRHREIQIPSAWGTSGITATVNRGSFPENRTAYLFVTNTAGVTSAGYPVTVGFGPAVPANVRIIR